MIKKTLFNNLRPKSFTVNNCFKVYGNINRKRINGHLSFSNRNVVGLRFQLDEDTQH